MSKERYVWWPAFQPDARDVGEARGVLHHLIAIAILAGVLCVPAITRSTGITTTGVLALLGTHAVWFVFACLVLARPPQTRIRANALMMGNLTVNVAIAVAIPLATRDPRTPLWMLPVVYACMNGALQERERCITFLLAHALSPLLGLIVFARGAGTSPWAIAAPLLCSALCAVSYHHLSSGSARWREVRAEQDAALASVRAQLARQDRARLVGDIDRSVGSALSVVGMYGDMIEENIDRPDVLRGLAAMVRDTARSGLGDLRGVIAAMAPEVSDIGGLAATLRRAASHAAGTSRVSITVGIADGAEVRVERQQRLAFVRVFQDEVATARHLDTTSRLDVRLAAGAAAVTLEIERDVTANSLPDGNAAPTTSAHTAIEQRVAELGGTVSRARSGSGGSWVRVALPRTVPAR